MKESCLDSTMVSLHLGGCINGLVVTKRINNLLVQRTLIILDGEKIMGVPVKNFLSDIYLCADSIY